MSGSTSNNYIGSGSDTITLSMSEDQALGVDAEFTVNVDGQQIGGIQTVTAQRSSGQHESFTFAGDFAPGPHDVTVTFANNFIYPGLSGDRNLYVDGVIYDGQTISSSTTPIYQSAWIPPNSTDGDVYGNAVFGVNDTTSIPNGGSPTVTAPGATTIGGGSDTIVLNMAEDAYAGDAQFTVSVDGQQIGGLQTVTAIIGEGQSQEFDVKGNFGSGTHAVTVNFTNDAVGGYYPDGTPSLPPGQSWALDTEDRNLYVMGVSMDGGTPSSDAPWEQSSSGTYNYSVTAGSNPNATADSSGLFASDGAAATSSNAAIPVGALSTQSSMTFMASPTTSSAASTTSADSTGADSTNSGGTASTAATQTVDQTVTAATPSTQDFSVPVSASSGTDTSGSGGSGASSSVYQMAAAPATHTHYHFHG